MCWDELFKATQVINAIGTLLIGGAVALIAYFQHKTNVRRLESENFERRMQVIAAIVHVHLEIIGHNKSEYLRSPQFHQQFTQRHFVFTDALSARLGKLQEQLVRLAILRENIANPDTGLERTGWVSECAKLMGIVETELNACIEDAKHEIKL